MSKFIIEGGHTLQGTITPKGAKNEALQVIAATLLTEGEVTIDNIPEILDVHNLIDLMKRIGVRVTHNAPGKYTFCAEDLDEAFVTSRDYVKRCAGLRGSVLLVGPLLARLGRAYFPKPGGDKIGRRKVDTHIQGMINLGAKMEYCSKLEAFLLTAPPKGLQGTYMVLDEASVTGTANIVMAASLAHGNTQIYNAACEPYLQQLCKLLKRLGVKVEGIASNFLTVYGIGKECSDRTTTHRVLPDMIEVGSFIGMAAMTRSSITIKNVSYPDLGIIPDAFRRLGVVIEQQGDDIYVPAQQSYVIDTALDGSIMTIADAPWPGLTPDLLSVMLVVATQCKGSVLIHQKMFESRLFFVDNLIDMGAQIILCDPHRAVVIGHDHQFCLRPNDMTSPDIRAGIALLIAALSAKGTSVIDNIQQIDRGYEDIEGRLSGLGANIKRVG
ncbi:MAG: UDP-N-acetylglucosamine 1-carboxyvinyltransferase [Bacteroides sp.]|nr:UDP-N-acetylglucosamine 1-carboxyvinyltransferase [Bacteroides sp.]MCM1380085.1 UDP-N-acetylglucosamine 1-carboxyvinyltransferase [Bacteroides sp.]MCM1446422.1 UDP-N-acetylglucosamine 1-carboxyvinyltransferase [Prevotella sp.]